MNFLFFVSFMQQLFRYNISNRFVDRRFVMYMKNISITIKFHKQFRFKIYNAISQHVASFSFMCGVVCLSVCLSFYNCSLFSVKCWGFLFYKEILLFIKKKKQLISILFVRVLYIFLFCWLRDLGYFNSNLFLSSAFLKKKKNMHCFVFCFFVFFAWLQMKICSQRYFAWYSLFNFFFISYFLPFVNFLI